MKTWKLEFLFVAAILAIVNYFTGRFFTIESLAALAVLLVFGHAQIADRMSEQEAFREKPSVDCYKKLWYYFISKEIFWCLYFFLNRSYAALVGVAIFLAYPIWRDIYRKKIRPLAKDKKDQAG